MSENATIEKDNRNDWVLSMKDYDGVIVIVEIWFCPFCGEEL